MALYMKEEPDGMRLEENINLRKFFHKKFCNRRKMLLSDKKPKISSNIDIAKFQGPLIFTNSPIPWIKNSNTNREIIYSLGGATLADQQGCCWGSGKGPYLGLVFLKKIAKMKSEKSYSNFFTFCQSFLKKEPYEGFF